MIINPFEHQKIESDTSENKLLKQKEDVFDIHTLQNYVITNFMEYLQKGLQEELSQKLRKYLIETYTMKENEISNIIHVIFDKMFGYDILQPYIEDTTITDIRVVRYDNIYVKRKGKWEKTGISFQHAKELEEYIRYCALKNSSNINFDTPMITVSDKTYHLRIEAGISPINVVSPSLVIRIHRQDESIQLESLFIQDNMLDKNSYCLIQEMIQNKKSIVISGKGGSGKTTLLRAILRKLPAEASITINEETSEILMENCNTIQREILENREGDKRIDLEKLMKQSLVMSNDYLVVGEIKGGEASSFIDAISTGHIGFATVHSSSAKNTLDRLVMLFKRDIRAQQYQEHFIREMMAKSIDYIIYMDEYTVKEIIQISYDDIIKEIIIKTCYTREREVNDS